MLEVELNILSCCGSQPKTSKEEILIQGYRKLTTVYSVINCVICGRKVKGISFFLLSGVWNDQIKSDRAEKLIGIS